uniref:GSCFA family n=1 Tax=uncultured Flavobacteriia bacterium TaxID=212695 RepID=H6RHK5_9BACT|nr:conserved hypothetical protein [uncultured bacterium]CCG00516.1 GSCFA family [uncultured Flavobacteriia bacterium]
MKLQTIIPLKQVENQIHIDSQLLLVGSCFVENIGRKLIDFKFKSVVNPFGILFHPEVIARTFEYAVNNKKFTASDVLQVGETYVSFDAHSQLNEAHQNGILENLNSALETLISSCVASSHIIITLGTAWGYDYKLENKIVANCHKIPQREFDKKLASPGQIENALIRIINSIYKLNTDAHIIFTVSPVRHIKDGFIENQRSKAHLITAIHNILDSHANVGYFPSYELMMDELRDYRFYDRDLIHPNDLAVDYIWERFSTSYFSSETQAVLKRIEEIQRGLSHRAFNPESKNHQDFLKNLQNKIDNLQDSFPHIRF